MVDCARDLEAAPFFADDATSPFATRAHWIRAADGVRLRVGCYGRGEQGTVLCFPGRTEYLEKYSKVASIVTGAGLGMIAVDWRGQGLAERLTDRALLGHVRRFGDYQQDVDALVGYARIMDMPRPWFLLAHSMGGAIGLRALHHGLDVVAAAFTAPMWGLTIPPPMRPLARWLPLLAEQVGMSRLRVPGTDLTPYVLTAPPESNLLTSDPESFLWLRNHVSTHPELGLGGPSMRWLLESMREFDRIQGDPPPPVPCQVHLGLNERIVCPDEIRRFVAHWPSATLVTHAGGEHEIMMERRAIRDAVLNDTLAFFAQTARPAYGSAPRQGQEVRSRHSHDTRGKGDEH